MLVVVGGGYGWVWVYVCVRTESLPDWCFFFCILFFCVWVRGCFPMFYYVLNLCQTGMRHTHEHRVYAVIGGQIEVDSRGR